MKSIGLYLGIRLRQALRVIREVGWLYSLLILPFVIVVFFRLLEISLDGNFPATALAFLVVAGGFHLQRGDHDFLRRIGLSPIFFRLLDYLLLFIPVAVGLLIVACWKEVLLVLLVLPLMAMIRPPEGFFKSEKFHFPVNFIPVRAFEWRSALRRYGWPFLLLYLIALAGSPVMGIGIGFSLLFALAAGGFFDELEEKNLLEVFQPVEGFLSRKIYWQASGFHGLMLPHYLLSLIFHAEYWYLLLAVVLINQSLLLFSLFYKYAHWTPQRQKAYNQMALGIFTGSLIIPFLAPAGLFYCWVYYKKARKNLRRYYD